MMADLVGQQPAQGDTTSSSTGQDSVQTPSNNTTILNQPFLMSTSAFPTGYDPNHGELQEFTLFPKLPLEIRRKIWSSTFEKRHIDLDIRSLFRGIMGDQEESEAPPVPFLPATLHVNQESRGETLRKYHAVYIPSTLFNSEDRMYSPGWINPSLDSIFFRHAPAICDFKDYMKWFEHICMCIPDGLKSFQELEVRHVWLTCDHTDEEEETTEEKVARLFAHVVKFTGLKTVVLTGDGADDFMPDNEELEELREGAETWLAERKESFVGEVAPVVKARQFEDLYTGEPAFD
jgi:2EXR family